MKATFQNKVSTSKLTLPAVILCGIASYLMYGAISKNLLPQVALIAVSTVVFVIMNSTFALLRIYSRTISSSFLLLSLTALPLINNLHGCVFQLLFIIFYIALFKSYQQKRDPSSIFLAFAILGITSLEFVQILFLVPVIWGVMGTVLMAGSFKNYIASIIGLACPYWIWFAWAISFDDISLIVTHLSGITYFQNIQLQLLDNDYLWILIFIIATALFVSAHYFKTSLEDKIRTRMLYTSLVVVDTALIVFLFLQPQYEEALLRAIIVSISPLLGHAITFSKSRYSNYVFIVYLITAFALIGYYLWTAL